MNARSFTHNLHQAFDTLMSNQPTIEGCQKVGESFFQILDGCQFQNLETYKEGQYLTSDEGLVLTLDDGRKLHITITEN